MPSDDPSQSADQEAKCSEGRHAAALALHVCSLQQVTAVPRRRPSPC